MNRVAAFIVNYNMPERADKLATHILTHTTWPVDVYLIDNGSDKVAPANLTNVYLDRNVQTTGGWLEGLKHATAQKDYFAYWFLITSAEFAHEGDPLTDLAQWLVDNPKAAVIHPALTLDSTTAWKHMKHNNTFPSVRPTWMVDNIASLYRADWFDSVGRFDPRLIYGWGIDLETCWKARRDGMSIWVDERVQVHKVTDIGYKMDRMGMSAQERRRLATANMGAVLSARYGYSWRERMRNEFTG